MLLLVLNSNQCVASVLIQEWAFMQKVTPEIRDAFGPAEQVLRETFIPALLQGLVEVTPGRGFICLPVKLAELALPDLTKTAPENLTASCVITGHLVTVLRG